MDHLLLQRPQKLLLVSSGYGLRGKEKKLLVLQNIFLPRFSPKETSERKLHVEIQVQVSSKII